MIYDFNWGNIFNGFCADGVFKGNEKDLALWELVGLDGYALMGNEFSMEETERNGRFLLGKKRVLVFLSWLGIGYSADHIVLILIFLIIPAFGERSYSD
jgi:hypothetical protein